MCSIEVCGFLWDPASASLVSGFTGIFYLDDFATLDAPSLETSLMNAQARGVRVFLSEPDAVPDVLLGAPVGSGTQGEDDRRVNKGGRAA